MTRSVRISMKAARAILAYLDEGLDLKEWDALGARRELRQAMAPPRIRPVRRVPRAARAARRQETADIWEACWDRADGECECGCRGTLLRAGDPVATPACIAQLDHFASRRVPQSEENCWLLRADCHTQRTRNDPDAATWLRRFIVHGEHHRLDVRWARNRLRFVEVRASLPAAPRL